MPHVKPKVKKGNGPSVRTLGALKGDDVVTLPSGEKIKVEDAIKRGLHREIDPRQSEKPIDRKDGYNSEVLRNRGRWNHRLMIGTPTTGSVRIEWVLARFGQVIPTNWSHSDCMQFLHTYAPMEYQVADAQNLIVKTAIEQGFEWLLLLEHDNVLPPGAFIKLNEYIRECKVPVVSGLYFTKSNPPEPMTYRGRGTGFYHEWKMGDKVWCDGVPTGTLLVHMSIIKALWDESPEYRINDQVTRKVFETPAKVWTDPETAAVFTETGTSDLEFCSRIMRDKIFEKAGWPEYQKMKYPFLVDTDLFVRHIDGNGVMFPQQHPTEIGF